MSIRQVHELRGSLGAAPQPREVRSGVVLVRLHGRLARRRYEPGLLARVQRRLQLALPPTVTAAPRKTRATQWPTRPEATTPLTRSWTLLRSSTLGLKPRRPQLAHDLRLRELVEGVYLKENVMSIESRLDQAQVTPRFGLGHRARPRRAEEEDDELGALTHERAAVIDRRHPERAELDLRVARDGRQALCPSPLALRCDPSP